VGLRRKRDKNKPIDQHTKSRKGELYKEASRANTEAKASRMEAESIKRETENITKRVNEQMIKNNYAELLHIALGRRHGNG